MKKNIPINITDNDYIQTEYDIDLNNQDYKTKIKEFAKTQINNKQNYFFIWIIFILTLAIFFIITNEKSIEDQRQNKLKIINKEITKQEKILKDITNSFNINKEKLENLKTCKENNSNTWVVSDCLIDKK